jgi:hypothetical protein
MSEPHDSANNDEPSIDIRTPGLIEAFDSVESLHIWELLRRSGKPTAVKELARLCRIPLRTVQRGLDRFEVVQLVRRHAARSRTPIVR